MALLSLRGVVSIGTDRTDFLHKILNRITLTGLLLAVQLAWLCWFVFRLSQYAVGINILFTSLSLLLALYIVRREENPAYKIPCHCRKPDIGMIEECADRFNIDLSASWMVGDTTIDIQTGINAGTHTALVLTGDAGSDKKYDVTPDLICEDLCEAVERIIDLEKRK